MWRSNTDNQLCEDSEVILSSIWSSITSRAMTATLYVSPDWDNSDWSTWDKAYNTINSALDNASTDANHCTLIMIWPKATPYDINTSWTPTRTWNYEIKGTHRRRAIITNTNATAEYVMKFTWKVWINDLAISTAWTVNTIKFTNSSYRIRHCWFNASATTSATKIIDIDWTGGTILGWRLEDVEIIWNVSYSTGLYINNASINTSKDMNIHFCLNAIHILDTDSDNNYFDIIDIWGCALWLNIDAWNSQHFYDIHFHENTTNIDDEVWDHHYNGITWEFPIYVEPENVDWITVNWWDNTWGTDTEIRTVATATKPFKVIWYTLNPSSDENTIIRFSADSWSTFFEQTIFSSKKWKASWNGDATDFIFNVWTKISASVYSSSSWKNVKVRLDVQEI